MSRATDRQPPETPLQRIRGLGQSVWLEGMRRRLATSGRLEKLVTTAAVTGVATDLELLAGAVARGEEYGDAFRQAVSSGEASDLPGAILAQDAALLADALQDQYEASGGREGLVSVPVDVSVAQDAEAMARAARRLQAAALAPNVMAWLPPTEAGFAVFETLVADGKHVHLGPVYTADSLLRAASAFLRGSAGAGATAGAVVSFGVGPLDNLVDQLLLRKIRAARHDVSGVESLLGSAAAAAAKVAWRRQRDLLTSRSAPNARLRLAWTISVHASHANSSSSA